MAKRDIKGVVDFGYLEEFAAGDETVIDEVLALFREQANLWARLLEPGAGQWRDAVHTIKGAARGVGAFALGEACAWAEAKGVSGLPAVRTALDAALADIAAYAHERAINALRNRRPPEV